MVEVSENPIRRPSAPEPLQFTPDLAKGGEQFKGNAKAQAIVDSKLGAAVITPHSIDIKAAWEVVPFTHNGCMVVHGDKAERTYDQLQSEGAEAMNKPTPPGAPGAKDVTEQTKADKVVQDTLTLKQKNETGDNDANELHSIQGVFKDMDKDQTQRVINSTNQKLAQSGLRYSQTADGAVWLGYKKDDGTFEASEYMRPPECKVS
jgi:hypothetical protein